MESPSIIHILLILHKKMPVNNNLEWFIDGKGARIHSIVNLDAIIKYMKETREEKNIQSFWIIHSGRQLWEYEHIFYTQHVGAFFNFDFLTLYIIHHPKFIELEWFFVGLVNESNVNDINKTVLIENVEWAGEDKMS